MQLENLLNAGFRERGLLTRARERGGALFFRVMAKQGHKISFLKILNYTSPPPLINYDQSLSSLIMNDISTADNLLTVCASVGSGNNKKASD